MTAPRTLYRLRSRSDTLQADLQASGFAPRLAAFLAGRLAGAVEASSVLSPRLADLPHPEGIPDMSRAVTRICRAVRDGENIVFAVDHDMDGQASAAVLWSAFTECFGVSPERLSVVSSHRLREGYGITPAVVDRVLEIGPSLVISADKGSSDEPRIAELAAAGIDVVVTDHHAVPAEGPPKSAYACVNPTREGSRFDATVCGAAVAFFCMALVRRALLEAQVFAELPSLTGLLDFVAVATIADCVSLLPDRAGVNRTLVRFGLERINAQSRPCWVVFCAERPDEAVDSQMVGFQLAPAIAAAGRLDWADLGFDFLTATSTAMAQRCWSQLKAENEERKAVERRIRDAAVKLVESRPLQAGIAVFLEDGHSGVHGITASRLVERYGRPACVFAPRGQGARDNEPSSDSDTPPADVLSGSFRSIPALHMRDALQAISNRSPDLFLSFGGHAGAAGASLQRSRFAEFADCFATVCQEMLGECDLRPTVDVDAELKAAEISMQAAEELASLDPWGRDFPPPIFASMVCVEDCRAIGNGTHLKLVLAAVDEATPVRWDGVWFGAVQNAGDLPPVAVGEVVRLVYRLQVSTWRGRRRLQMQIVDRWD